VTELGRPVTVAYDSLIVAAGAETSYFGHDEYRHAASGMKSLDDALFLRGQIFGAFERAEAEEDDARRQALQTFVVIGGGPTGVEMAGQLIELSHRALRRNYRRIDLHSTRVVLVEGGGALLASMGGRISAMVARDLNKIGVEVHVDTMVTSMDTDGVDLTKADGSTLRIDAATKVWAAGTRGSPLAAMVADATGADVDRSGRLLVAPDCSVPGYPEIFVVGDMMALNDLAGVAEVAMQSGKHAAHTIGRRLKGDTVARSFHYHDLGTMAAVSRFRAVAKLGPLQIGGLVGWLMWLVVHLTFLTEFKNRFGALARWGVSFVGRGRYERALVGRWASGSDPTAT
jgi:NADH dehydrogenase